MNERSRPSGGGRGTAAPSLALSLFAVLTTGCSNPFAPRPEDYGRPLPVAQLRTVDEFQVDRYERELRPAERGEVPLDELPVNETIADRTTVDVSLVQARAWTIENNLDLQVALIDPAISDETLSEEEAAFESTFFANFRNTDLDQPTASQLVGNQVETLTFNTGVTIPLRTGGTAQVRLPFSRQRSSLAFDDPVAVTSDLELSISQPLLRGGGREANTHGIRVAALRQGISQAQTKLELIRQIAAADRSYWRLYAARRQLQVRQEQYELALAQLQRARRLVNAGRAAEIEVVRAEEGLATSLEDIITANNNVKLVQRELKRIINVDGLDIRTDTSIVPTTEPNPAPYDFDRDQLISFAVARRMELLEMELQLAIDNSQIAFEQNRALPLFTLDYVYRINGLGTSLNESIDQASGADFEDWSLGLTAEIPIGNEQAKARVNRALLVRLQRLATRDARRLAIEQEVLDAIESIQANWQRILAARQTSILAGRTLDGEQRQFDVGLRTSTDVLDAAARLADAQSAEVRALADYQIAKVDLAVATGALLGVARVTWEPYELTPPRSPDIPSEDDRVRNSLSDASETNPR